MRWEECDNLMRLWSEIPLRWVSRLLAVLTVLLLACGAISAQPATRPSADTSLISLNFPENVDLKTVVDYVSQRLSLNIIYQDEQLASQRVTIKSPTRIPVEALPGLLQSVLRTKGLSLIDGEQPGWKRIVALPASASPATRPAGELPANAVMTQSFPLQFVDPQRADQIVKPFLSGPTASSFAVAEQHAILVTDYASNLRRIGRMLELVDRPNRNLRVEFVAVHNADAAQLAQQVKQILTARGRAQATPNQGADTADVICDRRTGQLMLVGPSAVVDDAMRAIRALDVPVSEQQSPIRFYKLANATAADVLDTIRALEGEAPEARTPAAPRAAPFGTNRGGTAGLSPFQGRSGVGGPSSVGSPAGGFGTPPGGATAGGYAEDRSGEPSLAQGGAVAAPARGGPPEGALAAGSGASAGLRTRDATVAADANTNTIIVIAEPAVQRTYEQLIRQLDKRRPQVLIEATIVTLDTSNGFTLGVEFAARSKPGKSQVISFSSFGLSTPDPKTGQLALTPGVGFNGAVIGSDLAQVILRALQTSSRARVTSAPRILVNDNATGALSSVTGQPFTSTNIGTSIATTSFGGYAEAGTTITLTPHISESDYLQLEYEVTLSNFTGTSDNGIPPPYERNQVDSKVTIPDGSTVIVGGLNRTNYSRAASAIPFLGEIPVLKYLFGRHDDSDQRLTLFVFIRPVILRDDKFEDLKFLSERDVRDAGLPPGMPASAPLPIR